MRIGVGRDLRQVGDAQDLKRGAQRPQLAPDDVGYPTANARIDLVENQTRGGVARRTIGGAAEAVARRRHECFDGEHDARQLAARHDPGERTQILARIGRDEELRSVGPARRPGALRRQRIAESYFEARLVHGEL